jgi:hypothetical protein
MSGVHQIQEQNERILAQLGERAAAEHPPEESPAGDADTRGGE